MKRAKIALGAGLVTAGLIACGREEERSPVLFEELGDDEWDETAVRKVLHVFAFGGFASDGQINTWAGMEPHLAIEEIVTLGDFNSMVAPRGASLPGGGLRALAEHWASSDSLVVEEDREWYQVSSGSSPSQAWFRAATRTGANPVRQKIGLIETYYHLSVNQDAGVNNWQMFRYYDDIMNALASSTPYSQVLAAAAQSAAVATQYNHHQNRFIDGAFEGNEDFGREIHQLYFGILGIEDPEYHEVTTIRNTSKALTDMTLTLIDEGGDTQHSDEVVTFGTDLHYPSALEVHGTDVGGATAREKIARIIDLNMVHPETVDNLPVIIIRALADDNLTDDKISAIRAAWAEQETEDLLAFLRSYAISTTFHNETRVKYWTSIDRNLIAVNRATLTEDEAYAEYFVPRSLVINEGVQMFRPVNNVFGGQTGLMASNSGAVFRQAYNNSTQNYWIYVRSEDDETGWKKDWAAEIPTTEDGTRRVEQVAQWLWQRFIADGLQNFGTLERAHVYALIAGGVDFAVFVDDTNPTAAYSSSDIQNTASLNEMYTDMGIAVVPLDSEDEDERLIANMRIGLALNFILATPFAFAQEGN